LGQELGPMLCNFKKTQSDKKKLRNIYDVAASSQLEVVKKYLQHFKVALKKKDYTVAYGGKDT